MPWNRSKRTHHGADHGADIVADLHEHVADFHTGLGEIEERLMSRATTVKGRLLDLEEEHTTIGDGLAHILHLRQGKA